MHKLPLTRRRLLSTLLGGAAGLVFPPIIAGCNRKRLPPPGQPALHPRPAAPAPAGARFADVTEAAGVSFIQSAGGCGLHYFVEQVAAGAALLDANGDGYLDIYFPQPKPLGQCHFNEPLRHRLYLNDGKGNFTLSPNAFGGVDTDYGIGAAVGDYDNDGHPDIYVTCYGRNKLFHNRGDGTFEDVTDRAGVGLGGFSTGATWFDYDGDGYLDLYVTRYSEWTLEKDQPCYANGKRDVCNPVVYPPARHALFHNNGDGTFTDVTMESGVGAQKQRGLSVAAADFNGDGKLDLFVTNDLGPNFLYINQGNGKFVDRAMEENVAFGVTGQTQANMGIAVGDYNNAGRLDILVTTFANEPYTLYRNDGLYFTDVSGAAGIAAATMAYLGFGTGFLDVFNQGRLDLFFANGHVSPLMDGRPAGENYKQRNQLLLNNGANRFVEDRHALPPDDIRVHRGACFGDINNDGSIDILVTALDDRPTLLKNESPTGNWLLLRLVNAHGCATPIGTRCIASFQQKTRLRMVLGGGSYGGSSDTRVHFGLGTAPRVDTLEIHWLSGRVQVLKDVKANQILTVHEGKPVTQEVRAA